MKPHKKKFEVLKFLVSAIQAVCLILTTAFYCPPLFAATKTDSKQPVRLNACLKTAYKQNPQLLAAKYTAMAAMQQAQSAGTLPDPVISYSYYIQEVETRVGPQRQKAALTQKFPFPGKLSLKQKLSLLNAKAQQFEYEAVKNKITYNVKSAFYEYQYLQSAIDINMQSLELLGGLEKVANTKFKTGTQATDLIKLQIEASKLQNKLDSLQRLKPVLAAKLNQTIGNSPNTPLNWPQTDENQFQNTQNYTAKLLSSHNNPAIKKLETKIQADTAAHKLSRKKNLPDITLGLSYIDTADASDPTMKDSGKDPLIASVAMNLPIWQESYAAQSSAKKSNLLARKLALQNLKNNIDTQKTLAAFKANDAAQKQMLYQQTLLPKARQTLEITLEAFRAGTADFSQLIQNLQTVLEFELTRIKARQDSKKYIAELEMLSGANIKTVRNT